jgi:leucine zipper transcription factor-like protein 1
VAKEEIDRELSHQSHTYVLLLRQLFLQAEHWHLKLQADISELENRSVCVCVCIMNFKLEVVDSFILLICVRELLDRVRNFENEQFSKKSNYQAPKLEAMNDSGGTMLLREVLSSL